MSKYAWVTLTTNDTYALGSLVLANSLKRVGTAHQLAVLVTPGVSESMRSKLSDVFNVVQEVNVLDSQDAANLALLSRPELGITFTKLHCWRLVQFEKCVFLDSDTIVLQNSDELFEREELSAAPDVSWPDCFNSGVFVFKPSLDTFAKIAEFAVKNGSFDGGDQGLLNSYFADWAHTDISKHLPFIYNVTAYASYCYLPAFKQFRDKIKILHFAGKMKPWLIQFNSESKTACTPTDYSHAADLIQLWWNIFCDDVHEKLTDNMSYWLANLLWSNYQQQNCHNHANQEYHNQQDHGDELEYHHHHLSQQQCHFDFDSVKEFRDPWEDYYENLERKENEETIEDTKSNDVVAEQEEHVTCETPEYDRYNSVEMLINSDNNNEITNYNIDINTKNDHDRHVEYHRDDETKQTEATISSNAVEDDDTRNALLKSSNCHDEDLLDVNNTSCTNPLYSIDCDLNYKVNEHESHENEAGLAGALSQLRLGEQRSPEQEAYEQLMRRQCWETGQVDYSGKDSFDNIWKKITQTLESKPEATAPPKEDEKSGSS